MSNTPHPNQTHDTDSMITLQEIHFQMLGKAVGDLRENDSEPIIIIHAES